MKKSRFTEEQIIGILREGEAGRPARVLNAANQEWALDFVDDVLGRGQRVRVLRMLDAYTRECVALEADTSFARRRVTRVLERLIA